MKPTDFQIWSFFVLGCIRSGMLYMIGMFRIIDPAFFTYQSFLLSSCILFLYAGCLWQNWSRSLFYAVFYPIYWGTVIFVSVAIVVIVTLNGSIFIKTAEENGGPNDIGKVHTADNIIHQWPWVELLFFTWFQWPLLIHYFSELYSHLQPGERAGYLLYILLIPNGILLFYMLNFDFLGNYPTPLPTWAVTLLVVLISLVIQGLMILVFYFQMPNQQKLKTI
jgi:hypothetical protein